MMKRIGMKMIAMLMVASMLFAGLPIHALADGTQSAVEAITEIVNDPGYLEVSDGYVKVQVSKSNGGFYVGTEEGDKLSKSDDNKNLLYPDSTFDTSFTSFRVTRDGVTRDYVFGRDYSYLGLACEKVSVTQTADNAIEATWVVDGLRFTQTIALMGADSNQHGMAYISYQVTDLSGVAVENVDARVMMDTALGLQDYAIYMLGHSDGTYTTVEEETTVSGSDYYNYFFAYDSKTAPTVTAYTLNASVAGEVIVPAKVTFAHWNNLAASVFDYEPSATDPLDYTDPYNLEFMTADSAVALYYSMGSVAASGNGKSVGLYYGVYSNHKATDGRVAMNYVSSGSMILSEDEESYEDLNGDLPGNYSMTIKLQNTGDTDLSRVAVAVYPGQEVYPYDGSSIVTGANLQNPFSKTVTDLKAGETNDVRFDFKIDPTYVSDYRKVKVVIYDVSSQSELTEENMLLSDDLYVLCPASDNAEIGFSGMSPDAVFETGRRFVYLTGSNFGLLRDKSQYRIILRPMDGGDDVVLNQDLVVIDPDRNSATLVLDQTLRKGTWQVIIDWNDAGVEDIVSDALRLNVTDVPQPGDPGFVSSGIYGLITVERRGNGTSSAYHYELVSYDSEEAYKNTTTEQKDIMLVMRGNFNVLSSEERGVFKAEALTLMEGEVIEINEALHVRDGRVTVTVNFSDGGNQTDITVDIDGDVRTAGSNTKVWSGICALTTIEEGKLYTIPVYSEQGELGYFPNEELGEVITLIWPGAANAAQTLVGLALDFRYGEMAVMEQGGSYARVIAFGAKLAPDFLVPNGTVGTAVGDSTMEKNLRELGYSNYTATQLRSTYTQHEREQRAWRNSQVGTLNLYMDDILFGKGGFIGFNTAIEVGIPAYVDGMPYIQGRLSLKIINDYWEFGVYGAADMMVFEMEAELQLKSYNGFPVPDKIYFRVGGIKPGIPVDPVGIFWIRGAGAGIDRMYESFFVTDKLPPLTLTLIGEFAIFNVLEAKAQVSLSLHGISAALTDIGIAGINILDSVSGKVYWYPNLELAFGIRVDIFDVLVGEGSIALTYDYDTNKVTLFQAYAGVTVKIPDKIFLIGGTKLGSASLGLDLKKAWCGVKIIGIGVAIIYYWGGDVDIKTGKKAKLPSVELPAAYSRRTEVYTDPETGETLYMAMTNDMRVLASTLPIDETVIVSDPDRMLHRFTLAADSDEDALLAVSYPAENALAAEDLKNRIRVTVGEDAYSLKWYDRNYDADHAANLDANAILAYDEDTKTATVSVSFTDGTVFGQSVEVSTPVAAELTLYGVERLVDFDTLTQSEDGASVTLTGKDLSRLSALSVNAKDENGAIYQLATVDVSTITGDTVEIPLTYPQNLPSGSYKLQAVGTVMDSEGEYEIACPLIETDMTYVNPLQPSALTSAAASLGGDYTLDVDLVVEGADYDGYVASVLELDADGNPVSTAYSDMLLELTEEERAEGLSRSVLLGGRYESTDPDTGAVTYSGLEEGRTYVVALQTYKTMEDGSRLLSPVVVTEPVVMEAPVEIHPVLSIENSVQTAVGGTVVKIDTIGSGDVTIKISGVDSFASGKYILGSGEAVDWDGGDITLTGLSDGMYTLQIMGVSERGDSFGTVYQFSVDTEAPAILITSPQGGGFYEGDFVEVTGQTEAGAKLIAHADDGETITAYADEQGCFSVLVPVNYALAYQDIRVMAVDAVGNESMPFGCTLTNHLMSDPELKLVILLNGEEVTELQSTAEAQQLVVAFKSGDDYVLLNEDSMAAARVFWQTSVVAATATVTDDGVLTGDPGAVGIVTVTLDSYSAMAELQPTDLGGVRATLNLPETPYVYDGTAKTPTVTLSDESLTEGEDYLVTYMNHVNAGTAVAWISAVEGGSCVGATMVEFTILQSSVSNATVTLTDNGTTEPTVTVILDGRTLAEGTDYALSYRISEAEGLGVAVISGIGNYKNVYNHFYNPETYEPETEHTTHTDEDSNHLCDLCGETVSEHADEDNDHHCDLCGAEVSSHTDYDSDHICDDCGEELTTHMDENGDHHCDLCGEEMTFHGDSDGDHYCDVCGEQITEPETDPTEPETDPTEPETNPTEPETDPTEPETDSTEPETDSTEPETNPTEPETNPTEPETHPTEPETDPTEPETNPTEPETNSTEPETNPTEPETDPTEPETDPETKPTEPESTEPEPETDPDTQDPQDTEAGADTQEPGTGGCQSGMGMGAVLLAAVGALILRKKKEEP